MMVTYNRLELTRQTLDNLFKVTNYPFRLIVVDNNSSDDTLAYLRYYLSNVKSEFFVDHKIIPLQKNLGIARGRNIALLNCESSDKYLSTIDNDVLLPDGWLKNCISVIEADPKYGMVGVNFEGTSFEQRKIADMTVQHKKEGNLGTACTVFPMQLHKMIGFFNYLDYGLYGLEDSDFGFRARVAGYQLCYISQDGTHLGVGEHDKGEYRSFKTKEHNTYLKIFYNNCRGYANKTKPIKISYTYEA
jgi:GT2 family glycosyltransferase